jgi:hypothetical protein
MWDGRIRLSSEAEGEQFIMELIVAGAPRFASAERTNASVPTRAEEHPCVD